MLYLSNSPVTRIRPTLVALALGTLAAGACAAAPEPAKPLSEWVLDSVPRRSVGDSEGGDSSTFVRITDARVLPSGVLVVADGGASATYFYATSGAEIARIGRKGRGPGEFEGAISLAANDSASVAVWDPTLMRWSLASPSSASATTGASEPGATTAAIGDAAWVHAGILVRSEHGAVPVWVPALLQALADSGSRARMAFVDETGLLWVHRDTGRREWVAYVADEGRAASAIGYVTVPAGLRVFQITERTVLGVRADSAGFESVLELAYERPVLKATRMESATAPAIDSAARNALMVAMRSAVVAQEMNYAERSSYTVSADSLNVEMPPGTRLAIISAGERGWSGMGVQSATGYSCGMFVGVSPPRGWGEGKTRCGW